MGAINSKNIYLEVSPGATAYPWIYLSHPIAIIYFIDGLHEAAVSPLLAVHNAFLKTGACVYFYRQKMPFRKNQRVFPRHAHTWTAQGISIHRSQSVE